MPNILFFGDNLHIMRRYVPDESVDLLYLDPPFNSNADYNVLFKSSSGRGHRAQIQAFEDTWHWSEETEEALDAIRSKGGASSAIVKALREALGPSDMMAYLVMMTIRLIELHRICRDDGSIYLHCDPNAGHYLKIIMDSIFGAKNFRNDIVWKRSKAHNDRKLTRFGSIHDNILFYTKSDKWNFNVQYQERSKDAPKSHDLYRHTDGNLYRKDNCRAPGNRGPSYEWNGHTFHWRYSKLERDKLIKDGRIVYSRSGMPRVLRPYDEDKGSPLQDTWTDIDSLNSGSSEILGYPTQKPMKLLERIIASSSKEGDIILDPFCGCGTAVQAAQKLGRMWMGIDITHLAIQVIADRLRQWTPTANFDIHGQPTDSAGAEELARIDKYQFQWWATWLAGGQPHGGGKKGADGGIDGTLEFATGRGRQDWGIISVKGGKHVGVAMVRELESVVRSEGAALGTLITLCEPTKEMVRTAITAGHVELEGVRYPRIQIRTVAQLLAGDALETPYLLTTVQNVPAKSKRGAGSRVSLSPSDALAQRNMLLPILGGRHRAASAIPDLFDRSSDGHSIRRRA